VTSTVEPEAASSIIEGIFHIDGRPGDIHEEVQAIGRLMEEEDDDGEDDETE